MKRSHTAYMSLLVSVAVVMAVGVSKAPNAEVESQVDQYEYAAGILCRQDMPVEIRDMILEELTLVEYADYLLYDPQTAQMYSLSDDREMALLRGAYLRLQELRDENEDESIIIDHIRRSICVIARKRGYSFLEYEQASAEKRPLIAAQGMERAITTLRGISTKPFWLRLGILAFINLDPFPAIHKLLSKPFKEKYYRYMLCAAALAGNMGTLKYLSALRGDLGSSQLRELMNYSCDGGQVEVCEWVLSKCRIFKTIMVEHALIRAVKVGQLGLLKYLMTRYPKVGKDMHEPLALLAIEKGKLAVWKHFVTSLGESNICKNRRAFNGSMYKAAANGNAKMLQHLLGPNQSIYPSPLVFRLVLQNAVKFGSLKVLEYFVGIPGLVNGLHSKFPELFSELYLQAAWRGDLHIVRLFLSENIDGTPQFPQFDPACGRIHPEIVTFRVPQGHFEYHWYDALGVAARWGHFELVQYLLMLRRTGKERFQRIDPTAGKHFALCLAIAFRHQSVIDLLFNFVNSHTDSSQIAVNSACYGNVKIIKALAKMGLLTRTSPHLSTTVKEACSSGHVDIVEYVLEDLLNFQIAPIAGEMEGCLKRAIEQGHTHVMQYLLHQKLDGSFLFSDIQLAAYGTELFKLAIAKGRVPIVNFLLSIARADINLQVLPDMDLSHVGTQYRITRIIISELYGPCPFPAGSHWERWWFSWKKWHHKLSLA